MLLKLIDAMEEKGITTEALSYAYIRLGYYYQKNEVEEAPAPIDLYLKALETGIEVNKVDNLIRFLSAAPTFCLNPAQWAEVHQLLTAPSRYLDQDLKWTDAVARFVHTKDEAIAWYLADELMREEKYEEAFGKISPYMEPLWKELNSISQPSADADKLSTVFATLGGLSRYQERLRWVRAAKRMEVKKTNSSLKDMIALLNIEASTHEALNQPDSAIIAYRKALQMAREHSLSNSSQLQATSIALSEAMVANGQTAEAEKIMLETFAQVERVLGIQKSTYTQMLHTLVFFYLHQAKLPEKAENLMQTQIPVLQKTQANLLKTGKKIEAENRINFDFEHLGWLVQYAYACESLADHYAETGAFEKGRDLYRISLQNVKKLNKEQIFILELLEMTEYGYVPVLKKALTYHLTKTGDMKEIRALLQELIKAAQKWNPEEKKRYSNDLYQLAQLCESGKCYTEATTLYKKLLELLSPQNDDISRAIYLHLMERLAVAYESANEPMKAVTVRAEAMTLERKWW